MKIRQTIVKYAMKEPVRTAHACAAVCSAIIASVPLPGAAKAGWITAIHTIVGNEARDRVSPTQEPQS